MSRPTARVLALLEILQAGGVHTLASLAERLDVDARTVRRYVDHLIDLDIPVESVRGRYGGYPLPPRFRMPPPILSGHQAPPPLLRLLAGGPAGWGAAPSTAGGTGAGKNPGGGAARGR